MSLKATATALDAVLPPFEGHDGDPIAKLVLILIADFADDDGIAEFDVAHLAERSGLTFEETERVADRLRRAGYLDSVSAFEGLGRVRIGEPADVH